jgi:hypothetical protein
MAVAGTKARTAHSMIGQSKEEWQRLLLAVGVEAAPQ